MTELIFYAIGCMMGRYRLDIPGLIYAHSGNERFCEIYEGEDSGQGTVNSYRDLIVWQKAMLLVEKVYRMTKAFPPEERFDLASQIQRAAVSIPSNIAEGQTRQSTAEFKNFLSISMGSRAEVETQTLIAIQLGYVTQPQTKEIMRCNSFFSCCLAIRSDCPVPTRADCGFSVWGYMS